MNFSKPLRNLGNSYACVGFSLERDEDRHGASESGINVGMDYLVSETHVLSPLTPALSPLRGEGAANGHHYYSFGVRHSYDGVQRTARPTQFGSGEVSRSEWSRGLSINLTKFACEGNEVLGERFCRRAGRRGSTAGETPATTMGVGRATKDGANRNQFFHYPI